MRSMSLNAKLFISAMAVTGVAVIASGLMQWQCQDPVRFLSFLIVALIASRLKVKLPGTNGNMSVNLTLILIALAVLSFSETVLIAAAAALIQGLPAAGKNLKPVQTLFNVSTLVVAVAVAILTYKYSAMVPSPAAKSLLIALAGAAFLVADTLPVAAVISLTENLKLLTVWRDMLEMTFSYFALSASAAAVAATATRYVGWQTPLLVLPVMTASYFSYKRCFRSPTVVAVTNLQFSTLPSGAREQAEVEHF